LISSNSTAGGLISRSGNSKLPIFLQGESPIKNAIIEGVVVIGLVLFAGINNNTANIAILFLIGAVLLTAINSVS
jgi:hypothetical protein